MSALDWIAVRFGVPAVVALAVVAFASPSQARLKIVDGGSVSTCSFEDEFGAIPTDGAVSVPIGTYDSSVGNGCDPTALTGFSINIAGTDYNSLFVNENGIVSFGAPITDGPATPLFNLTTPAFAPFFADGFLPDANSLQFGYTNTSQFPNVDSIWLTWNAFLPQGNAGATPNVFQLGIIDVGGGDFDLIFNYESINWDSATFGAQAGVTNGLGAYFLLAGAGVPGAYLGFDDTSGGSSNCSSATPATALACNQINDGSSVGGQDFSTGSTSNGYYLFKFRDGVLVDPSVNQVPLPAAMWLFLLGATALFGRRVLGSSDKSIAGS